MNSPIWQPCSTVTWSKAPTSVSKPLSRNKDQHQSNSLASFATCLCRQWSGFSELQAHQCIIPEQQNSEPGSCAMWVSNRQIKLSLQELSQFKLLTSGFLGNFATYAHFQGGNTRFAPCGRPGVQTTDVHANILFWYFDSCFTRNSNIKAMLKTSKYGLPSLHQMIPSNKELMIIFSNYKQLGCGQWRSKAQGQSQKCQRWVDCEIFQSESSPDLIKLNPIQSWSAEFFLIISPIQCWSTNAKSFIFLLSHVAKELLELFCL